MEHKKKKKDRGAKSKVESKETLWAGSARLSVRKKLRIKGDVKRDRLGKGRNRLG